MDSVHIEVVIDTEVLVDAEGCLGLIQRIEVNAVHISIPRVAEYPGAFSAHTHDELRTNTRKVLWPQIRKALTEPLRKDELVSSEQGTDGIVFTGSLQQVQDYFAEQGQTDGLPITPPTREAVAEFLKFCDAAPDTVVAKVPPSYREVTVQQVAVNGVMAGCPAEYMPILIAFTKAMTNGDFRRCISLMVITARPAAPPCPLCAASSTRTTRGRRSSIT